MVPQEMNDQEKRLVEVCALLTSTMGLPPGTLETRPETPLLGALPELDSVSVMSFLINLEEQYGIVIADDEVDAGVFQTLGSVTDFVSARLP